MKDRIKKIRKELNLTQQEFANRIEINLEDKAIELCGVSDEKEHSDKISEHVPTGYEVKKANGTMTINKII